MWPAWSRWWGGCAVAFTPHDRRYALISIGLASILVGSYLLLDYVGHPPSTTAPTLVVPTTAGSTFDLAEQAGHVVVVDFFATWCVPCHYVDEQLAEVQQLGLADVTIVSVGVDVNETMGTLAAYREARAIAWTVGKATGDDVARWEIDTLAHVAIIDPQGRLHQRLIGTPSAQEILDAIADAR